MIRWIHRANEKRREEKRSVAAETGVEISKTDETRLIG